MKNKKNFYEILEIEIDASEQDIKLAYRRLAKKYHPDLNKNDPNTKEKFIELKNAYDTLVDPVKRKIYDQAGYNPQNIDLGDVFHNYNHYRIREILREIFGRNRTYYYKPAPDSMYV